MLRVTIGCDYTMSIGYCCNKRSTLFYRRRLRTSIDWDAGRRMRCLRQFDCRTTLFLHCALSVLRHDKPARLQKARRFFNQYTSTYRCSRLLTIMSRSSTNFDAFLDVSFYFVRFSCIYYYQRFQNLSLPVKETATERCTFNAVYRVRIENVLWSEYYDV